MNTFTYVATDSSGKQVEGTLEALSLQAAHEAVIELGLEPLEIYEAATETKAEPPPAAPNPAEVPSTPEALQFSGVDLPVDEPKPEPSSQSEVPASTDVESTQVYFPLLETLRLYAGWLLAWYSLVYAVGSYQFLKELPFRIPYTESLFLSPLVLSFTFGAYLFLLLTGFYKLSGKKKSVGLLLFVLGIALFLWYRMNVR